MYQTCVFTKKFLDLPNTAQKMKFPIEDFFSKCDQIRSFLRIWSHLLKKSLMGNFIFCAVKYYHYNLAKIFFEEKFSDKSLSKIPIQTRARRERNTFSKEKRE